MGADHWDYECVTPHLVTNLVVLLFLFCFETESQVAQDNLELKPKNDLEFPTFLPPPPEL